MDREVLGHGDARVVLEKGVVVPDLIQQGTFALADVLGVVVHGQIAGQHRLPGGLRTDQHDLLDHEGAHHHGHHLPVAQSALGADLSRGGRMEPTIRLDQHALGVGVEPLVRDVVVRPGEEHMRDQGANALHDRTCADGPVGPLVPGPGAVHGMDPHMRMVPENGAQPALPIPGGEEAQTRVAVEVIPLPGIVGGHDHVQCIDHRRCAHDGRDMAAVQRREPVHEDTGATRHEPPPRQPGRSARRGARWWHSSS